MTGRRPFRDEVEIAIGDDSVREAGRRMLDHRVGALVVVDDDRHPIGIVTDRDLALRVVGAGRDADATRVADVMTHPPVVIAEETPVAAALRLMSRRVPPFRRLPVVDRNGRLIGVLSIDDALREIASELAAIDLVLRGESPYVLDGLVVEGESRSGTARER